MCTTSTSLHPYTIKAQLSSFIPIPLISPSLIRNLCPSAGCFYPLISSFSLLLKPVPWAAPGHPGWSHKGSGRCFFGLQVGVSKVLVIRERNCGTIPHPPLSLESLWGSGLLNTASVSLPAQLFHARETSYVEFGGFTPSDGKGQASCMQELQYFIHYFHFEHSLLKKGHWKVLHI